MAAFVAGLTGRIPLADDDEVFALILQFVFQKLPERAETVVHSGFPKGQRLGHRPQIEVFHAHCVVGIGYLPTPLVAEVQTLPGDFLMEFSDSKFLLPVIAGAFLHLGQFALFLCQLSFRFTVTVGRPSVLAVAVYIEHWAAVIQADSFLLIRNRRGRSHLLLISKENGNIAFSRIIQRDCCTFDRPIFARKAVDHSGDEPQLRQFDPATNRTLFLGRDNLNIVI